MIRLSTHVSIIGLLAMPSLAWGQGNHCSDVLAGGTFQQTQYRDNAYFQQIIYSRFASSSYQQSKSDRSLGFGIPLGEAVMGTGDYSEAQFNQKKQDVRSTFINSLSSAREIDVALASGDATVISAWRECMSQDGKGYLSLTFEPLSPTQVFVKIAWTPGRVGTDTGVTSTRLDEDLVLPAGASFQNGGACFKAQREIRQSPCTATINLSDAKTSLALSVNSPHGSSEAYLPPRVGIRRESRPFPFSDADKLREVFQNRVGSPRRTVELTAEEIAQGWRFDSKTAKASLERIDVQRWVHTCSELPIEVDQFRFSYSYQGIGANKNPPDRATSITCRIHPSIMMVRETWVPIGSMGEADASSLKN